MKNIEKGQKFLDTGLAVINEHLVTLSSRKVNLYQKLKAPSFVIDGIIPEGVGIIAGSAGIGKTTGIVPLASIAAGFSSHLSDVKAKRRRHVVILTEDESQVSRLLFGMTEWLILDSGEKITIEELSKWMHLFSSQRLSALNLRNNLREASSYINVMKNGNGNQIEIPPLVVIDTAAANFDISNENANSEISSFMAILKEMHTQTGMNIWVIAHLAKTAKGANIDEMDSLSARGGGAWEADANWTAVLSADDDGKRILKMNKRRVELNFGEIYFHSTTHSKLLNDEFGDEIPFEYRYVTPVRSDYQTRMNQKMKPLEEQVLKALKNLEWPSKNEIQIEMGGKSTRYKMVIDSMIARGILKEEPLPATEKKKGRKTYLALMLDDFN